MKNYFRLKESIISRFYGFIISFFLNEAGKKILINTPLKMDGLRNISIGNNVVIGYKCWFFALKNNDHTKSKINIGSGSAIGSFNHIVALNNVTIGKNVLISDKVYISDNLHNYEDINTPIIKQSIRQIGEVVIGDGSWIGENACIIGAKVGMNCVVGANAVVTKDIPDFSVAVGIPARVIKKYDFQNKKWISVR